MKEYLTPIVGLVAFITGLLAWRMQLLDKRRFEVADQALVTFAKIHVRIADLRTRHSDWSYLGQDRLSPREQVTYMRVRRYSIPEAKEVAFKEVYKELSPAIVLSKLYLDLDIVQCLNELEFAVQKVRRASAELVAIAPDKSAEFEELVNDPAPPSFEDGDDEGYDDREARWRRIEKAALPIRFMDTPDFRTDLLTNELAARLFTARDKLQKLCKPYQDVGPWHFLARFGATLIDVDWIKWRRRAKTNDR